MKRLFAAKATLFGLLLSLFLLAGCSAISALQNTPGASETSAVTPVETLVPTAVISQDVTPTPPGPVTLQIWVPPQFDPQADTPVGDLLRSRLDEFSSRRPDVRVEVRVKAVDGPGGLLDSLTTASAAAPLALPDVVALPRTVQETAALKGLLHPFDGLTTVMEDSDWYAYARQLAQLQSSTFGLPFAGDALIMVYRPNAVSEPPADWASALITKGPLAFPAADPQSLFTLTLYQSSGGNVRDDQGRPILDADTLGRVLTFYQDAETAGVMPFWLTQYQTDDQAWEAFTEKRADMAVTWTSRYLANMLADTASAPIPTEDGAAYTLATGWVWALASPQPEKQALGAQLAEFLTESDFLAQWTLAAGYLPPRPSSLQAWPDTSLQSLMSKVILSAQIYPSGDVLTSLGPLLEQATVQVLKEQADPATAAQDAVSGLPVP